MQPSGSLNGVTFSGPTSRCTPSSASLDERDHLAFGQARALDLVGIDQQHLPRALDAAQPVAEAVDRRVELVVAAHA